MDARGGSSSCPGAARSGHGRREWAAEPPGTNELRADKSRPGMRRGGAGRPERSKKGEGGRGGAEERGGAKLVGAGSCAAFAEGSALGKDQPLRRGAGAAGAKERQSRGAAFAEGRRSGGRGEAAEGGALKF